MHFARMSAIARGAVAPRTRSQREVEFGSEINNIRVAGSHVAFGYLLGRG
jgi:hypothetical protein